MKATSQPIQQQTPVAEPHGDHPPYRSKSLQRGGRGTVLPENALLGR